MIKKSSFRTMLLTYLFVLFFVIPTTLSTNVYAKSKPKPGYTELTQTKALSYNKISLKWNNASNATHYKIYYRPSGTSKWTNVAMVSGTSYVHTANNSKPIIVGQKYDYTVRGYNATYKTSGKYDKVGKTIYTKPTKIKLKKSLTTLNFYERTVKIHWNKGYGCDYYKIYRKSKTYPQYKCIATVKTNKLSYTDKKLENNEVCTYTVRGYYSKTKTYGNYDKKGITVELPYFACPGISLSEKEKEDKAQAVIRYTNEERKKVGVPPLIYNASLQMLAMERAKELEKSFSHTRPNGKPYYTIVENFELGTNSIYGENIAGGTFIRPDIAVELWVNSPGHYANMTKRGYTHIGVGCHMLEDGSTAWVQLFGSDKIDKLYNISFNLNGGKCDITSMKVHNGKEIFVEKDFPKPTREGYKFIGWKNAEELESSAPLEYVKIFMDECFIALWEKL